MDESLPPYASTRVGYSPGQLTREHLASTPLGQFERWYTEAVNAGLPEPNAMVLATVDPDGLPAARTVLLKQADRRGFVFFTNHDSRKGRHLAGGSGGVALVFGWYALQRQICVRAVAERLDVEESRAYFESRPWDSRIGAWASRQSAPVADRVHLAERFALFARRWPDHGEPSDVPLPSHWGGYVARPIEIEFWEGRPSRLHDRLVFLPAESGPQPPPLDDARAWRVERRQP